MLVGVMSVLNSDVQQNRGGTAEVTLSSSLWMKGFFI
jgi:hypothetical protein